MARTISTLVVKLGSDITEALSGINAVGVRAQKLGRDIGRTGQTMTRNFTAPITAAGAAALGAAVRMGNVADKLLDLEQQTGLSTDTLQEYRRVATVAGVESDTLANAVTKLNTRIKATGDESLETENAFRLLGVSTRDAGGNLRDMNAIMPEILGRLMDMENVTERNSLATQIFGRGATDLLPVLGLGAERFGEITTEANELGLVLSGEALAGANAFRVEWDSLLEQLGAVANELGVALVPMLQGLVTVMRESLIPILRSGIEALGNLDPAFVKIAASVAGVVAAVGPLLIVGGKLISLFGLLLSPIGAVIAILGSLTFAVATVVEYWDEFQIQTTLAWAAVREVIFAAVDGILAGLERLVGFVPGLGEKIGQLRDGLAEMAEEGMAQAGRRVAELNARIARGAPLATNFAANIRETGAAAQEAATSLLGAQQATERLNVALATPPPPIDVASRVPETNILPGLDNLPTTLPLIESGFEGLRSTGVTAFGELNEAVGGLGAQGLDAVVNFATGAKNAIASFVQSALAQIAKLIAKMLIVAALNAIFPGSGTALASSGLLGRAEGGPVQQGRSFVVGERGPELLTMAGGSGRVSPNNSPAMTGGGMSGAQILEELGPPPRPLTPSQAATDAWWRQVVQKAIPDNKRRTGRG